MSRSKGCWYTGAIVVSQDQRLLIVERELDRLAASRSNPSNVGQCLLLADNGN